MAKPFDATLNRLIDLRPDEWAEAFARIFGLPSGPCSSLDTDLATTVQADRVFKIGGPMPTILHLEFESSSRLGIPGELLRYNTLVDLQHGIPVVSGLVLLRPKAVASDQTGLYRRLDPNGRTIVEFQFFVERVWERTADYWLNAGLALAPLALITDESDNNLQPTLERFREKVTATAPNRTVAENVIGSSFFLCGLRHDQDEVEQIYRRLNMIMEDSSTYQATINKGFQRGFRKGEHSFLLRIGTRKYGQPDAETLKQLDSISDERLASLADRVLDAESWESLLAHE